MPRQPASSKYHHNPDHPPRRQASQRRSPSPTVTVTEYRFARGDTYGALPVVQVPKLRIAADPQGLPGDRVMNDSTLGLAPILALPAGHRRHDTQLTEAEVTSKLELNIA